MMQRLVRINAVLWVALGIAFGLYAPIMLNFFGVPEVESNDLVLYWNVAAFTRLYGAALFGFGFLLWAIQNLLAKSSVEDRRGILFSLILANIMGVFVSATQNVTIWNSLAGWILTALYLVFAVLYAVMIGYGRQKPQV